MKVFASYIVFSFSFFAFGCAKTGNLQSSLPKSGKVILEVTSDFRGMWWMNGKVIDFRLYEDGTVKYDEYPTQSKNGIVYAVTVKSLKQTKIDEVEFKEFLRLLMNSGFLKTGDTISPQKSCIDAFINTEINFDFNATKKNIILENHCSTLADSQSTSFMFRDFPPSLNQLFLQIKKIKSKESNGKFYN